MKRRSLRVAFWLSICWSVVLSATATAANHSDSSTWENDPSKDYWLVKDLLGNGVDYEVMRLNSSDNLG
ncbi:MAG: hypothetical protein ACPH3C_06100, partial [Glaciecola sp.]